MTRRSRANTSRFLFRVGDIEFLVVEFHAVEGLSTLFEVDLSLALEEETSAQSVLGQVGLLTLMGEEQDRFFHGLVSQFEMAGSKGRFSLYQVRLVPSVWLATQQQNCRIFQNKNTPDIVKQVLEDVGITSDLLAIRLQGTYAAREYCVQHRESDMNFIARLLEEEGIFFFFEHSNQGHILVLGDSTVNYQPIPGTAEISFNAGASLVSEEEAVYQFHRTQRILPGKYTHTDFNFEKPSLDLKTEYAGKTQTDLEIYDFPGEYLAEDAGKRLAKVRLEQCRMFEDTIHGESVCPRFLPAFTFTLRDHETAAFNAAYVLTQVIHMGSQPQVLGEISATDDGFSYTNQFMGVPSQVTIRPERTTPKPVIQGVQTAIVTGPTGEEIYPDKFGRVKVKFHWDRLGSNDETSSCWIRVSQPWAGSGWGAMFIPRVGQEVIVDFLNGDPDRPIITGRVYHAANMPPYDLPAQKTKSTLKSNSSTGGQGCNEIRFEDKKGEEELYIQAEKDMRIHVKNDQQTSTGRDCHLVSGRDTLVKVDRDLHLKVSGHEKTDIGTDYNLKVGGKAAVKITGSCSVGVDGDVIESFGTNHIEQVTSGYKLQAVNALIEAHGNITLKCGGSSIVLTPGGIFIEGAVVNVNSGAGPAASVSAGSLVPPAVPIAAALTSSVTAGMSPADAAAHDAPTHQQTDDDDPERAWVEIELVDEDDRPVPGERYRITLPDGSTLAQGTTDADGLARVSGFEPGTCKVTFPDLDQDKWEKK